MTRKWFQIHLSTAVVLMFVAGCLMWVNFHSSDAVSKSDFGIHWTEIRSGWPAVVASRSEDWYQGMSKDYERRIPPKLDNFVAILINIVSAMLICSAVAAACEWIIRRREAPKP
jgi:hypothetical protein